MALITGAGSGIGRAIASAFASEAATVIATDLDAGAADRTAREILAAGGRASADELDVTKSESVTATIGRAARLDVLVNNAGINVPANDLLAITDEDWDRVQAVNLRGVFLCMRAALPGMIERGRGSIVNISSVNGLMALGSDGYSAAKAGALSLTRSAALQYGPRGIRVNAICPGTIVSPAWDRDLQQAPDAIERLKGWYALGRVGTVDDVTPLAVYLASDDSAFVTGATITVDGGLSAGIGALARKEFDV